jgi:ankyrin repeat protein
MSDDIFAAISANDKPTVAALLDREPGLAHARNQAGVSALMQAVYENRPEIVDLLRGAAGDLDIHEAAALGDVARLQIVLAQDATQASSRSNDGFTPLHLACLFRQLEAAQDLLAAGADPNAVSASRIAIIHSAAASREAALVRLVLAAGANPDVQQQGGYTALQSAAAHNHVEMARALLAAGADRSIANDEGLTAWDMAMKNGAKQAAELLAM